MAHYALDWLGLFAAQSCHQIKKPIPPSRQMTMNTMIMVNFMFFHHRFFLTVFAFLENCLEDSATASTHQSAGGG